jgi:ParB family chromosome partitioning protein
VSRVSVTNLIRLTELEEPIQTLVQRRALSAGHAKVLLGMPEGSMRVQLAASAAEQRWSVRELEKEVKEAERAPAAPTGSASGGGAADATKVRRLTAISDLERRIEEALGTRVRIEAIRWFPRNWCHISVGTAMIMPHN